MTNQQNKPIVLVDSRGRYYIKCEYCGKIITGLNEKIVLYDYDVHLKFCKMKKH